MKKLYKKLHSHREESGAVALLSVFVITVLIGFTALSMDVGLHYYLGARLQKAVDSAATAVAGNIGSEEESLEDIAYEYLALNGYNKESYGDKLTVTIEHKGLVDEDSLDEEDYLTTGYYKVTASAEDSTTSLAKFAGVESYSLTKVAYVKCDANYIDMPDALKYSIFAGSTDGTQNNAAMQLNGRTGTVANTITDFSQWLLNGINSKIVQPIIGIFGGNPDYSDLVHVNTSEIISDADAHSNSTVSIGVQALNASRLKDSDFNGANSVLALEKDPSETQTNPIDTDDKQLFDGDYGQVTYSAAYSRTNPAAGKFYFNRKSLFSGNSDMTHIYIQNQQYLERSNMPIFIVDSFDFTQNSQIHNNNGVGDTSSLQYRYKTNADNYLDNVSLMEIQDAAVKDNVNNLRYINNNVYRLENQTQIVYDLSHEEAKTALDTASKIEYEKDQYGNYIKDEAGNNIVIPSFVHLMRTVNDIGVDYSTKADGTTPWFQGTADKIGTFENTYELDKYSDDGASSAKTTFQIAGRTINRDLSKVTYSDGSANTTAAINNQRDKTAVGATYAMARTFRENSRYIPTPDLRPYFTRQVNQSVKYATQGKNETVDDADRTVKAAVKSTTEDIDELLKNTKYTDETYFGDNYDSEGNALNEVTADTKNNFNYTGANKLLFSEYKSSSSSKLTDLKKSGVNYSVVDWTLNDTNHKDSRYYKRDYTVSSTSFKGYDLYDTDGSLKTPSDYVDEFDKKYISTTITAADQTVYGSAAVEQARKYVVEHDDDHDDYKRVAQKNIKTDYQNHYGEDAVEKKKAYLQNNVSYTGVESKYANFDEYAPAINDVFLRSTGTPRDTFNAAMDELSRITPSQGTGGGGSTGIVEKPEIDDPNTQWNVTSSSINSSISPKVNLTEDDFDMQIYAGEAVYQMEDLLPAYDGTYGKVGSTDTTISYVLNKYIQDNAIAPQINVALPDVNSYTAETISFDGGKPNYSDENNYMFNLKNNYSYGRFSNPRRGAFNYNMGFNIKDGYNVYMKSGVYLSNGSDQKVNVGNDAQLYVFDSTNNSKGAFYMASNTNSLTVGDRSIVYIDGTAVLAGGPTNVGVDSTLYIKGNLPWEKDRAMYIGNRSNLYIGGNAAINGNGFSIGSNGKCYIGGRLDTNNLKAFDLYENSYTYVGGSITPSDSTSDCSLKVYSGATLIVNGDLKVNNGHTLYVEPGATLIVKGTLDCSNIDADNSTIYAGAVNCGRTSGTITFGNLYVENDLSIATDLAFSQGSQVLIDGNLSVDKSLNIGKDCRIEMRGTITKVSGLTLGQDIGFYLNGSMSNTGLDLTISDGSGFCFTDLTMRNVTVDGYLCVPGTLTVSSLTTNNLTYANNLTSTGDVSNTYSLIIGNSLSCSANVTNSKNLTAKSMSISSKLTNNNNSTIYVENGLNAGSIENKYELRANTVTTGALESSGFIEVGSTLTCSSFTNKGQCKCDTVTVNSGNFTNSGKTVVTGLTVSGDISNTSLIVVNGNASAASIDNAGDGMYVTGNINATGTFSTTKLYVGGSVTGYANITNGYIMVVDGGVQSSSFHNYGQTIIGKTLTVYAGSGSVLENNGSLKCGSVTGNANITNSLTMNVIGVLEGGNVIGGNIECSTLSSIATGNDSAIIYAASYINCAGDMINGSSQYTNAVIYAEGYIYIGGNLTNYGKIASIAADYTDDGAQYKAVTIMGAYLNGGMLYIPNGSLDLRGAETRVETDVYNNYGNLVLEGTLTQLIARGTLKSGQIINYGNIYVKNSISLEYLYNTPTGRFACNGSLYFTGYYKDNCSVVNEGEMYVEGDLTSVGTITVDKGTLYVLGDITAANVKAYLNQYSLRLVGEAKVYTSGWVSSTILGRTIKVEPENGASMDERYPAVLSIYGYGNKTSLTGHNDPFGNGTNIECNTPGAKIYLGCGNQSNNTGSGLSPLGNINLTQSSFTNYSSIYAYGNIVASTTNTVNLSYDGETFVKGNFYAPLATINITKGHTLVVNGKLTASKVVANQGNIYLMSREVSVGSFDISNGSVFYADKASGLNYNDTRKFTFKDSTVYLPEPASGTINFSDISFNGGGVVTNANLVIDRDITINKNVTLYVGGTTTVKGDHTITNNGNLYFVGDTDLTGLKKYYSFESGSWPNKKTNYRWGFIFGEGSDTFIGGTITDINNQNKKETGSIYSPAPIVTNGNVYIDGNIFASYAGDKDDTTISSGDRYDGIYVNSGNTYISGNATIASNGKSFRTNEKASFSCGGDLNMGSAIYNKGKTIIFGSLNMNTSNEKYLTDKGENNRNALSLLNGKGEENDNSGAYMFVGGTSPVRFFGGVKNSGKLYMATSDLRVEGYFSSGSAIEGDMAFDNFFDAETHLGGDLHLCSNGLYNRGNVDSGKEGVLSCQGSIKFGEVIYNCGDIVAKGDISNDEEASETVSGRLSGKDYHSGFKSIVNGAYKVHYGDYFKCTYPDALIFCGGNMKLGTSLDAGRAGSFMTFGTTYVGGNLDVFCNRDRSYFRVGLWAWTNSDTFVGGSCSAGAGAATGDNSIFMCGGDFTCNRSLKINVECHEDWGDTIYRKVGQNYTTFTNNDNYTPAYFYVGGNFIGNSQGVRTWWFNSGCVIPENSTSDLDIKSNTNMFVGGQFYTNAKINVGQNTNIIVVGARKLSDTSRQFIFGDFLDLAEIAADIPLLFAKNNNEALYTPSTLTVEPCSNLVVNGNGYAYGNVKLRDMVKSYFNGNFRTLGYIEIGKALDGVDETEARESTYRVKGDDDGTAKLTTAHYARAGYMTVNGNFSCGGYTKVYAATKLRIAGDYTNGKYLTLRHDASIYVGKKLRSITSIEGGSYSQFFVGGSMQATLSNIKLRDRVQSYIGGNMVAPLGYIELGKAGDYVKTQKSVQSVAEGGSDKHCTCSDNDGCPDCTDNKYCGCECGKCIWHGDNTDENTGADADNSDENTAGAGETVKKENAATVEKSEELENDKDDKAYGGTFYIGGVLASYSKFIKEFAYSKVVVGGYTFANNYITLRHNADLWVIPEIFDQSTYVHKDYEWNSDGTLLGNIFEYINMTIYNIRDTFSPKNGSIYSLGQVTLNTNASIFGSYDLLSMGKYIMRPDSLVYLGHDFTCVASAVDGSLDTWNGVTKWTGFDSSGRAEKGYKLICTNREAHGGYNYTMYVSKDDYRAGKKYVCDTCGEEIPVSRIKEGQLSYPAVIYADNQIDITTTIDMSCTYLVANKGNVNLYDMYSKTENYEQNAKELPNAIASYKKNINYNAIYGELGALFYAPKGTVDFDGYVSEIWGSVIGDRVTMNTYYLKFHRFANWRTMDLHVVDSGSVFLISEKEYEEAEDNMDDSYNYNESTSGKYGNTADIFFY